MWAGTQGAAAEDPFHPRVVGTRVRVPIKFYIILPKGHSLDRAFFIHPPPFFSSCRWDLGQERFAHKTRGLRLLFYTQALRGPWSRFIGGPPGTTDAPHRGTAVVLTTILLHRQVICQPTRQRRIGPGLTTLTTKHGCQCESVVVARWQDAVCCSSCCKFPFNEECDLPKPPAGRPPKTIWRVLTAANSSRLPNTQILISVT